MDIPEVWVLGAVLFIFPYLIARKGVFDFEKMLHYQMDETERYCLILAWWLLLLKYHVMSFYSNRISPLFQAKHIRNILLVLYHKFYTLRYYFFGR